MICAPLHFPNATQAYVELDEYEAHTQREDGSRAGVYAVVSEVGSRFYVADDFAHAREQHDEAFPEESVLLIAGPLVRETTP